MASLKFEEDESGNPTRNAVGMYSKDKEYVDFDQPCECIGQVCMYRYIESNTAMHALLRPRGV